MAELEFSTEIENIISALNRLKRLWLTCCKRYRRVGINSHGKGKHTGRHGLKYRKKIKLAKLKLCGEKDPKFGEASRQESKEDIF